MKEIPDDIRELIEEKSEEFGIERTGYNEEKGNPIKALQYEYVRGAFEAGATALYALLSEQIEELKDTLQSYRELEEAKHKLTLKLQKQIEQKETFIKRLKELKPYHIMPYNLGEQGEIASIIDKL